jgi:hypothetical protein
MVIICHTSFAISHFALLELCLKVVFAGNEFRV